MRIKTAIVIASAILYGVGSSIFPAYGKQKNDFSKQLPASSSSIISSYSPIQFALNKLGITENSTPEQIDSAVGRAAQEMLLYAQPLNAKTLRSAIDGAQVVLMGENHWDHTPRDNLSVSARMLKDAGIDDIILEAVPASMDSLMGLKAGNPDRTAAIDAWLQSPAMQDPQKQQKYWEGPSYAKLLPALSNAGIGVHGDYFPMDDVDVSKTPADYWDHQAEYETGTTGCVILKITEEMGKRNSQSVSPAPMVQIAGINHVPGIEKGLHQAGISTVTIRLTSVDENQTPVDWVKEKDRLSLPVWSRALVGKLRDLAELNTGPLLIYAGDFAPLVGAQYILVYETELLTGPVGMK